MIIKTTANSADALPLSHRDKQHHQPVCLKFIIIRSASTSQHRHPFSLSPFPSSCFPFPSPSKLSFVLKNALFAFIPSAEVEWKKGWQRRTDVFCDVWLSSGSRRSPLLRRYRSRGRPGRCFPCEVFLASVVRTISKKTAYIFFPFFFNTSPSFSKNLRARSREKKRVEQNQTALLVGDIYSNLRADLPLTDAINVRFFSLDLYTKG